MTWLFPTVAAAALVAPLHAQPDTSKLVKASLLAHDTKVKPGDTVQLAVVLDVAKGWHIYWPGQNESGMPTEIKLEFPAGSGLTAGPVSFPVPHRHIEPGDIINYTHEGRVTMTVPVKVPATAAVGTPFKITANVSYLVCKDACMPGDATLTATITTADKTEAAPVAVKAIDDARAAQPKPQADGFDAAATAKWGATAEGGADTLTLTAKDAKVTKASFFPTDGSAKLLNPIKTGEAKGGPLTLTFEPGQKPVEGVVELTSGNTTKAWTFHMARPQSAATPKDPSVKPASPAKDSPSPISPAH